MIEALLEQLGEEKRVARGFTEMNMTEEEMLDNVDMQCAWVTKMFNDVAGDTFFL